MKTLPKQWYINICKDMDNFLMDKFKGWISDKFLIDIGFRLKFNSINYGFDGNIYRCTSNGEEITLQYWHDCVFGEEFEQGEEVLVKDSHHDSWTEAKFICEYKDKFLVEWKSDFYLWHECKRKPSELDIKIDELRKLAEEKGLKITINFE